ncbi:MAG: hypothetical protein ACRDNO_23430, partial [Trebonia sp.]
TSNRKIKEAVSAASVTSARPAARRRADVFIPNGCVASAPLAYWSMRLFESFCALHLLHFPHYLIILL